jgi:hypothetical protein
LFSVFLLFIRRLWLIPGSRCFLFVSMLFVNSECSASSGRFFFPVL